MKLEMKKMKILVTGFDPFGNETINPASEAVKKLPDQIDEAQIVRIILPTVFKESLKVVEEAIENYNPDVILSVGQAGGRNCISVERVAINVDDARIEDNAGNQPIDEAIDSKGPAAYFSTLPIKAMVEAMKDKEIPAAVSNTAGTFVCNHVMYGVLHLCATRFLGKRAGFIHIPFLPEQVKEKGNIPSMELDMIVEGLILALKTVVETEIDIKISGGREC